MAVYTDIDDETLRSFLTEYDIGRAVSLTGIAEGIENSNFLLVTDRGRFILTLYEKRVDAADLPFFLGLLDHLAAHGVRCPTPIHGRDGHSLRRLCGRPAAIVTFLSGRSPKRILPHHLRAVGAALAELHLAGAGFPLRRANALGLEGWRGLAEACAARADEVSPGLAALLAEELATLRRDWPADLPSGVIHADLFPDNVFFEGDTLSGLIDFYFACNDLFAYDIAICLNAWCFEPTNDFNVTKARNLIEGYDSVRPVGEAEIAALPLLARGAALRFLLTRLYDWLHPATGALVRPKDPLEYGQRLRFQRSVTGPQAYGLD
ncbi:homoserine kinase [Marinivivus vitaminiproducens]|uniref:homoserine kinase n=1 Tax=Marinivivus vitaminiproducens TaxID=3035935 RepID=UPI0027A6D9CE|nr:homoserine kinase [Geminicoccaceae bacterium SCSIO 64248]